MKHTDCTPALPEIASVARSMRELLPRIVTAVALPLIFGACSMSLDRNFQQPLAVTPSPQRSGKVFLAQRAEGVGRQVGWGRFTVFYIPLIPVRVEGDANAKIMETVAEALRISGYEPVHRRTLEGDGTPIVTCKVEEFWFNNYTWLWPWVPTWGDIRLQISVERGGVTKWSRTFSSSGRGNGMIGGFSDAGNAALGQMMDQMARTFVSDDFYGAVNDTEASAMSTGSRRIQPAADPASGSRGCTTEQVLAMKRNGIADHLIRRACQQEE